MIERLIEQIEQRYRELTRQLADPEMIADRGRYTVLARSHRELEQAHRLAEEYRRAESDAAGAEELLQGSDGELDAREREELQQIVASARARMDELEQDLRLAMVEKDPNDSKNVIVEIRAGAGGDEAALFAGDLYRMLTKYAERRGFAIEPLAVSPAEVGGFKEIVFAVKGEGAYSVFKHEAGVHRVQRVPKTESQGRIHTSTATVAVLPEAEEVDVEVDPNDLQIDVYRSSGPGGQSVNTTDSAVRITHRPSGLVVSVQDEKSQLQNRERALRILRARLYERALREQQAELAADRRAQVGSGERPEKVRTYNFPQGRVTDHRVKLTTHNLGAALEGELDEFTEALAADERRRKLEAQAD
jgi:peptide chain release factor 1